MSKELKEVWRNIPKYEGLYQVSNLGKVRSLDRHVKDSNNERRRFLKGKLLKHGITNKYQHVTLCIKSEQKTYSVHCLVMLAFKGTPPKDKEVAHNNGVRDDNKLTNLRYATKVENSLDRIEHGTSNKGERHGRTHLTETDVRVIRKISKQFLGKELARRYNVSTAVISNILSRKSWVHI